MAKMVRYVEQTNREKQFQSREGQLGKPASAAAAKGKSKGKGTKTVEIAHNGRQEVNALEVKSVD